MRARRFLSTLFFLLVLSLSLVPVAEAQTPSATIENGNGDVRLQLFYDGALLAPGIFNPSAPSDSIPAEGAGTRLMWYPAKAAFRAGQVGAPPVDEGSQWDAENVGKWSAAFGANTIASGRVATAMGAATEASGDQATAMGQETIASNTGAVAMGFETTASGNSATTMGFQTTASGDHTMAMGYGTEAATDQSLSLGECNDANRSAEGTLLAVGNGSFSLSDKECTSTSDALVLDRSGNLTTASSIESKSGGFVLPDGTTLEDGADLGQLSLPFSGSASSSNPAFEIENTGSGPAVRASSGDLVVKSGDIVLSDGTELSGSGDLGLPTNGNDASLVDNDDGLLATGTQGSGSIPTEGSGTRMMWYPADAAFRAGQVDGTQWDAANVGLWSTAFGYETTASGDAATAMNAQTTASGNDATAMGFETTASGTGATAMGDNTTASGDGSTAMGNNTTAATSFSLAIGEYNSANTSDDNTLFVAGNGSEGSRSDALVLDRSGNLTTASSIESKSGGFVLPDGTILEDESDLAGGLPTNGNGASLVDNNDGLVATGTFDSGSIPTEGAGTRMMWYPSKAAFRAGRVGRFKDGTQWDAGKVGEYSVAFGTDTKANGRAATAIGDRTTASGGNATAMGFSTTASGTDATAMGNKATASGFIAIAMGGLTTASGDVSVALGSGTVASATATTAMGKDTEASGETATAMGEETKASGETATAMGFRTTASGVNATAMGDNTTASAPRAVAMGQETNASSANATAMGRRTAATEIDATAMGKETTASNFAATAMGDNTTASGANATAMGDNTTASSENATTMGLGTTAATERSLSLGECNDTNTSSDGTLLVVGNGSYDSIDDSCFNSDALVLDTDGDLMISGTLTESSDRRLKTDVEALGGDVLQKLANLRPVHYRFKNKTTHPSNKQIGLLAQDVRREFPTLVSKGSNGYLALSYSKLTAVLLKGIQEQQTQIKRQQATIDSLNGRVRSLQQVKQTQEHLARQVATIKKNQSGGLPAGWGASAFLALLLALGGFGAGLLWRHR